MMVARVRNSEKEFALSGQASELSFGRVSAVRGIVQRKRTPL